MVAGTCRAERIAGFYDVCTRKQKLEAGGSRTRFELTVCTALSLVSRARWCGAMISGEMLRRVRPG